MQYLYVSQPAYSAYYLEDDWCGNTIFDFKSIVYCDVISFCNDVLCVPVGGYAEIGRAVL